MSGRKGGFAARKPGHPNPKVQPLKREYEEAPKRHGKGDDKPKVSDLPLGDRSKAKMG